MSSIVRYPISTTPRTISRLAAVAFAVLAVAAPTASASYTPDSRADGGIQLTGPDAQRTPDSRADGGIQLSTAPEAHSPAARADGGIQLPSSHAAVSESGSSNDGVDWGYFAAGGFVLLMLAGAAFVTRRRRIAHVRPTPAH
jgi:MYXO-CTERM domain-containing protein